MDSIFFLGQENDPLPLALRKLGYAVVQSSTAGALDPITHDSGVDLILIDARITGDIQELCARFRGHEETKTVPIVCICEERFNRAEDSAVEVVQAPFSIGALASRIALSLRLRKVAGRDERRGSLAEINATLREKNTRFKKEIGEARSIQQSLLPRALPKDPRIDIAVSYQPLDEVGGDWYFAQTHPDKKISLQIADVSGHGLSAAFIGSMAKLAMTAAAKTRPDELLAGMNKLLAPQLPPGRFVTMGGCLYDLDTGDLQWARAGHPPALIVRAGTNTVQQILGEGFAVGFFEDSEYSLIEERLNVGDALLMFTDGVSEAQDRSGEAFGVGRLSDALAGANSQSSCGAMLMQMLDVFDAFRGDRLIRDDITLMLLKRVS